MQPADAAAPSKFFSKFLQHFFETFVAGKPCALHRIDFDGRYVIGFKFDPLYPIFDSRLVCRRRVSAIGQHLYQFAMAEGSCAFRSQ
jgi:hypothetical protein